MNYIVTFHITYLDEDLLPSRLLLLPHQYHYDVFSYTAEWTSMSEHFYLNIIPSIQNRSGFIMINSTNVTLNLTSSLDYDINIYICPSMETYGAQFTIGNNVVTAYICLRNCCLNTF